jgi:hypothetical protein
LPDRIREYYVRNDALTAAARAVQTGIHLV